MTPARIEPSTYILVAQYRNQLRNRVSQTKEDIVCVFVCVCVCVCVCV